MGSNTPDQAITQSTEGIRLYIILYMLYLHSLSCLCSSILKREFGKWIRFETVCALPVMFQFILRGCLYTYNDVHMFVLHIKS